MNTPSLHPDHLADLRKSELSDETIREAGIKSLRPTDIDKEIGFQTFAKSVYEIPYPETDHFRKLTIEETIGTLTKETPKNKIHELVRRTEDEVSCAVEKEVYLKEVKEKIGIALTSMRKDMKAYSGEAEECQTQANMLIERANEYKLFHDDTKINTLDGMLYSMVIWQELRERWKSGIIPDDPIKRTGEWYFLNRSCYASDIEHGGFISYIQGRNMCKTFRNAIKQLA